MIYVPEKLIVNKDNKKKILEIIKQNNFTDIVSLDQPPRFDIVGELEKIGEYKLAKAVKNGEITV